MVCILGDTSIQILRLFFNWAVVKVLCIFWIQVFYGIYDLQREFKHFPSSFCYRFILPVVHLEQKTSGPQEATSIWLISSMVLISWTWQTRCTPRWAGEYQSWALTQALSHSWCRFIHEKFEALRDEVTCPSSHRLIHDTFHFSLLFLYYQNRLVLSIHGAINK